MEVGRPVAKKLVCARAAVEATYFQLLLYTRAVKLDSLLYIQPGSVMFARGTSASSVCRGVLRSEAISSSLLGSPRRSINNLNSRHLVRSRPYANLRCKCHPSSSDTKTMGLLENLKARGLFENCTDEEGLEQSLSTPIKVYCGFDPTADSLHLGNLLGIVVLSWFQRFGHQPVVLLGGATGRVGDPSGKSQERPLLAEDVLQGNSDSIRTLIQNIICSGSDSTPVLVVDNYDWFKNMSFLDFLRDVGKYARVGSMLSKDSVRSRLDSESGLSFTEFSYQLLQGYDFMHLFSREGVSVQVGGSDQWGNITAGTELIRRVIKKEGAQGLTFPLLLKSDGSKFGKSASGAVWLSREKLSPYKFYQYLLGTTDSDVIRLLKMLTFLPLEVIHQIEHDMSTPNYIPNTAQRLLAEEVTSFVHGERGLEEAVKATESLRPGNDTVLDAESLKMASESIPQVNIDRKAVIGSMIVDVMPMSGLLPTKGATRRMIANGGVRVNNVKVENDSQTVEESDVIGGDMILLAAGKKNKLLVYLV